MHRQSGVSEHPATRGDMEIGVGVVEQRHRLSERPDEKDEPDDQRPGRDEFPERREKPGESPNSGPDWTRLVADKARWIRHLWAIIGVVGDRTVKPPLAAAGFAAYMLYYQFITRLYQGKQHLEPAAKFRCQSAAGTHQIPLPRDSVKSRYTFDSHDFSTLLRRLLREQKAIFPCSQGSPGTGSLHQDRPVNRCRPARPSIPPPANAGAAQLAAHLRVGESQRR